MSENTATATFASWKLSEEDGNEKHSLRKSSGRAISPLQIPILEQIKCGCVTAHGIDVGSVAVSQVFTIVGRGRVGNALANMGTHDVS